MRGGSRLPALTLALLLAGSSLPGVALHLGRDVADRPGVQVLRRVDLARVLDGHPVPPGWQEAAARLPARCTPGRVLSAARPGTGDLRCAWLVLRSRIAAARAAGDRAALVRAAERLHRVSLELGEAIAARPGRRSAARGDAARALLDDALVHLALLVERGSGGAGPVLPPAEQERFSRLVRTASRGGLEAVPAADLRGARDLLVRAWRRELWLARTPALRETRRLLLATWGRAGGVPRGCGRELFRPDLLEDQWRGYLVREVVPAALECLASRWPRAVARGGLGIADPEKGPALARELARSAAADPGGRRWARDERVVARIARLGEALRPVRPPASPRARRSAETPPGRAPRRVRPPAPASRRVSRAAPPSGKAPGPSRPGPRVRKRAAGTPFPADLARRVDDLLGEGGAYVRLVRAARTARARERAISRGIVRLHRRACAPLVGLDPADLEAVRGVLADLGIRPDPGACEDVAGLGGLSRLAEAAPALMRLAAATRTRTAARLLALGRPAEARARLEEVPEEFRGLTWTLVAAWCDRVSGDPVAASRRLAPLEGETLDRLRGSPDEAVARLVAHAWVNGE